MRKFLYFLLLFSAKMVGTVGQNTYGLTHLAEQMDQYCRITSGQSGGGVVGQSNTVETRVGKAGPRGPPGPPGIINYYAINDRIDEKLAEYESLVAEVKEMRRFVEKVEKGYCQVIYNGRCFWFIASQVNYVQARQLCVNLGAAPANIYSEEHYGMLLKYVRGLMKGVTEPWLGMSYDFKIGAAFYYNGTTVTYPLSWHPGYPQNQGERTRLNLSVRQDANSAKQGIWDVIPTNLEEGVLCEI